MIEPASETEGGNKVPVQGVTHIPVEKLLRLMIHH